VLTRCTRREANPPRQPLRARAKAVAPTTARVELPDQIEQPRGGGIEMCGELRDLVTELLQLKLWIECGGNSQH
jgi:hypothetical protein